MIYCKFEDYCLNLIFEIILQFFGVFFVYLHLALILQIKNQQIYMSDDENKHENRRQLISVLLIPTVLVVFMILVFVFEKGMEYDFHSAGIYPRSLKSIAGVFTYIFIHADIKHLLNNIFSFFVLSISLFYFYKPLAIPILIYSNLASGAILWIIGRESWHIGASGLIYAIAFFLFFSGILRKHIPLVAISFVVIFLYGNMVWHVFPWQVNDPISWEGHLSGGFAGLILSVIFRNAGPQKPQKIWDEEDEREEFVADSEDIDNTENAENVSKFR